MMLVAVAINLDCRITFTSKRLDATPPTPVILARRNGYFRRVIFPMRNSDAYASLVTCTRLRLSYRLFFLFFCASRSHCVLNSASPVRRQGCHETPRTDSFAVRRAGCFG